ncbi:O-antigen ligase family protein [Microbacterium sp. P07]|uniref:O-antigen ligase family protein n=1 Tax=Microbacterium sp. P07 TaxID=3366952 RepID=UPI003745FD3F
MAVLTKHPASAPPEAPPRETTGHLLLRGWCVFVLFSALAGTGWVLAIGSVGAGVLAAAATLLSVVFWLVLHPPLQWRRLPWVALAFVLWAAVPVIWSPNPANAAVVWMLLTAASINAMFIAAALTWRDVVRSIASAVKWVIGLSVAFEVAVAIFVGGPILPGFVIAPAGGDSAAYWSSGDFFGDGPLEGIVGDPGVLGALMVLAIIVFVIRFAARAPRRPVLLVWIVVAGFILVRSGSTVSLLAVAGVTLVLATVLLMRTATHPGERTRYYLLYATAGIAGGAVVWISFGDSLGSAQGAWAQVFDHLGPIGVVLLAMALLAFIWRAWFFAVDRPRFDLVADRPYSPLALLPTLLATLLLVEGVAEPGVLLLWGWMLLVLLGAKIKQAPLVGVGPAEQSLAIERGEAPRAAA